ncbi:hypothetical protein Pla175_06970 [Pirellulimonas nuda]|uniref:AsmA-like C-terminal domain-containing protein n=1 Tax=Pirellulimonas nuda TaxID=2528009 RepID=A0A518D771_9BACT|nr:hypothetical protein Pla175_06970 [Pirellulimonas nuda]
MFRWSIAVVIVAALGLGGYLFFRLDDEIRRLAEHSLAEHYPTLAVHVGGARYVPGRGVTLYDISFAERGATGQIEPLLSIAELGVQGDFRIESVVTQSARIERVIASRPVLHATRTATGRWSVQRLLPPPKGNGEPAPLEVHDAVLIVSDPASGRAPLVVRGVQLTVAPLAAAPGAPGRTYQISGGVEGTIARRLVFEGQAGADGSLDLHVEAKELELSNEMLDALPGLPKTQLGGAQVKGLADVTLDVRRASAQAPLDWRCGFELREGQLAHPMLPRRMSDIAARGSCDARSLQIEDLTAKLGVSDIRLALNRTGWDAAAPAAIAASVTGLPLDTRLYGALPTAMRATWDRFRPAGTVDASGTATLRGGEFDPNVRISSRDLSFEDSEEFPYRLTGGEGEMNVTRSHEGDGVDMRIDLRAKGDGGAVEVHGELRDLDGEPTDQPTGWLELRAPAMQITESLLAALNDQAEPAIRMLNPRGSIAAVWRMERSNPHSSEADTALDLTLVDCQFLFEKFKYPLSRVQGTVHQRNERWGFDNLFCDLGPGQTLTAAGSRTRGPDGDTLRMTLRGVSAPLDETLRAALPAAAQQAWVELRPRGTIDFIADIEHLVGDKGVDLTITATPHERSVAIEPACFPFRLEQLDGTFVYSDGHVQATGMRGLHGRTTVQSNALWSPAPGRGWRLVIDKLFVDRLTTDRDLLQAAPPELRRALERLKPTGGATLSDGAMVIDHSGIEGASPRSLWQVNLNCLQAELDIGVPLTGVSGTIKLEGEKDATKSFTKGVLELDSAFFQGFQVTNIRGPFWADQQVSVLGQGVSAKDGRPARQIEANLYGGDVKLDARVLHSARPNYYAQVAFSKVDLGRLARESLKTAGEGAGTAEGRLDLRGEGTSLHGLAGQGEVHVRDAQYFELPVVVSLLKVLRNRAPDTSAFYGCDAVFDLKGEDVQFSRLNLLGDAVSLYGRGRVNLDHEIDLLFHSVVGPAEATIPVLRNLMGRAGEQLLQLKVTGTFEEPEVRREAFPVVGDMLQQLQQGLTPTTAAAGGAATTRK